MTGWRLVDGSRLEDWHPGPGDAPCPGSGHPSHRDHSRDGCPLLWEDNPVDDDGGRVPLFDPAVVDPGGRSIYLGPGETCLDCSSTALVGHWHTPTDCLVARTGWGGP